MDESGWDSQELRLCAGMTRGSRVWDGVQSHPGRSGTAWRFPVSWLASLAWLLTGVLGCGPPEREHRLAAFVAESGPQVLLSRGSGPPTSRIVVTGSGFVPGATAEIGWDGGDVATVMVDADGSMMANIVVPAAALPGFHLVGVRTGDGGAETQFLMRTNWPQLGFFPSRSGVNRFENVLGVENVAALAPRWSVKHGAQWITPVVATGRVYAPSTNGVLYAYDAASGRPLWVAETDGTSNPVSHRGLSTPAAAYGKVFVASREGAVYAFAARTGARLWKVPLSGRSTSAVVVADGLVYATTTEGTLAAMAEGGCGEAVCSPSWSTEVGGSNPTAPTVAHGKVFVAADGVGVRVFPAVDCSSAPCAPLESLETLGTSHGWLAIARERLAVQAQVNGQAMLLVFDLGTKKPLWQVDLGSARTEGMNGLAALAYDTVFVTASQAGPEGQGELRAYDLADGRLRWVFGFPAAPESTFDGMLSAPTVAGPLLFAASNDTQETFVFRRVCLETAGCAPLAKLPGGWQASAAIVADGQVYVSTVGGDLRAWSLP